ncbi:mechanosensitive ion channel family protein [Spirosoma sp. KNUC1025]|uniref:mechanosensitive ion channel family protein n=1 Tax=Spirosoma sp. KNUC1025 TaxID=2894082 RepID=UPI00386B0B33|nr:mechanosensitive ion channel [Spirosoma sp. KNUC1025]
MEQAQTKLELFYAQLVTFVTIYGGRVLLAIITLFVGLWAIGWVVRLLSAAMTKRHVDRDVQPFLLSLVSGLLRVLLLLSIASTLGIQTTSFVAIIGAAGLAVGLALQGSLSNFAGGVLILIFKPFRVGDLISAQGFTGNVEAIRIFDTTLVTPDNKTIILPNGALSTSAIMNISTKGVIRVDQVYGVGSQNDLEKTKASIQAVVDACPFALKDRQHDVLITKLNPNSREYDVRVWTNSDNYWATYYYMLENIARQFAKDGIEAPKPKMFITNEE